MIWSRDSIAKRFACTVAVSIVLATGFTALLTQVAGPWAGPSFAEQGLIERTGGITRMIGSVAGQQRDALARAAAEPRFTVHSLAPGSAEAGVLGSARTFDTLAGIFVLDEAGQRRQIVFVEPGTDTDAARMLRQQPEARQSSYIMAVSLADGGWVVFDAPRRFWGLSPLLRTGAAVVLLAAMVVGVSTIAAYQLSRPIRTFAEGLRRFGKDPRAAPLPVAGPFELREAASAFNGMQSRIQTFVADRTAMLAAISHDLRTPLTRIRLRGEFVEDADQRMRLFRDVDEMQAMVDSALSFFREDGKEEAATSFDLPELLKTIVEDFTDQGHSVAYEGPERLPFTGRPFALKRAFSNVVDNAVKYGGGGEVEMRSDGAAIVVAVRDRGPGLPPDARARVFDPFYRVERSRNRGTGGVGLGLTSARSIVQEHGGTIELENRASGGLDVRTTLPR